MYYIKRLYIFFSTLALIIFFFSTEVVKAKSFEINDIEISQPFEINFDKNKVIDLGFKKAFFELIYTLIKSSDFTKIDKIKLNEIKSMIDSFSIKEEKFINQTYYVNLGVSFNRKKIFNYLESESIFPSQIIEEKFLFVPIIIDQINTDLFVFSNNPIYENWKKENEKNYLINYILPTEDLDDLNLIKENYLELENYNFEEIIKKYFLDNYIIALFFKDDNQIKVLSKINIKEKKVIKSNSFKNIDLNNPKSSKELIDSLKVIYEDFWKENNLINTSIKLPLLIQVNNKDFNLSLNFEETLDKIDLISHYSISKFNKDFIFYEVIFNGTPKNFINIMGYQNYNFDTQKKIWILK